MLVLLLASIVFVCVGGMAMCGAVIYMNKHHKALAPASAKPQLRYARQEPARVVSSKLSTTPARRATTARKNYLYEEEEMVRQPLPRKQSDKIKNSLVRRECSTWVLVFWWVTVLFCWFTLILQAIVEVIK